MSHRYGVRQVLHANGLEVPYELVPDGIRGMVHDVYPNPGIDHFWTGMGIYVTYFCAKKVYRTLNARAIYKLKHPNRRIPWRAPFISAGRVRFI